MQQLRSELDDAISQLKDREYREQEFEIEKLTCIKECEDRVRDELSSIFQQNLQDVIQKAQNEKEMLVMKEAQLEEKVRIMQDSLSRFKTEAAEVNFANEVRVTALQVALEKHRDHEDELNTRQAAQKQREKQYSENLKEVIEENKKEMKRRESEWGQLRLSLLGQISNQQAKQQQDKKKYIKVATEIQRLKRMLSDFKSEVESEVTVMDQHLRAILVSAEQQAANVTARQESKINSLEEEVLALSLYLSNEKREKDQIKMELDYKRDEIDSISVEMSSIKAKLVSVDVEQRICKEQLETKTNIATTSEISLQILMKEKESLACRINELEGSSAKEIEGLRRSHQKLVNNLEYKNASISAGLEDQVGRITIERDEEANRRELQIAYLLTRHTHQIKIQSEILETVRNDCLGVVKKLQSVEESCESGYSCQLCLAILRQPLICAPCGHTFCRSCFEEANRRKSPQSSGMYCPECNNNHVTCAVPSKGLDLLVSKFEFRKRVLGDLMGVITNWGRCRLRQLGSST